jgi:hypothetical protein
LPYALIWLTGMGTLFVNGGCRNADGPARIAVVGTVTSASGDPVDGMISFLPEAGTKGPAATASLVDGMFQFDKTNGPVAGKYRVLVVKHLADVKYKGASSPAAAPAPATTPRRDQSATAEEWSFEADVSHENFEFDFEVPDATVSLTSG